MTVGYIGLGVMGRALATHLPGACDLQVFDLSASAMADLAALGATTASSPAALGRACDVVMLCLPRSADVEQVLFGPDGLASGLAAGSVVVDQTSGVPGETRRFAARLAERGVALIDAPVAGGVPSARAGIVTIMASGDGAAFATALPLLRAMTPNVYRCSDRVGDAQALKSINNIINAADRVATLEIAALGRAMGVGMGGLATALDAGAGRNFMTAKLLPAIAAGRSSTDFALALMVKDLNQASALARASGAAAPLSDLARGVIQTAANLLGPAARLDDMVPFMERVTGRLYATGPADEATADAGGTIALLDAALAASNRAIVLENVRTARRVGLDLPTIEPILASGSAQSAAARSAFAAVLGEDDVDAPAIADTVALLDRVAEAASRHGVPMLMTTTIHAFYRDRADRAGPDADSMPEAQP